ncbi:Hypothetical_protein [Hexamita inflata]|uniref:Hypothetical_protein n=1 Tax=Hexamita inflata TaxID=28002 RepID=A0AA86UJS6_9EUKA|nr:Hypothetical protein HINF_LOCUS30033 [Hexamita inflata]CAI9966783.1 Hypothetical protein HINF_LOCUS54428 [Hexamita inflata]
MNDLNSQNLLLQDQLLILTQNYQASEKSLRRENELLRQQLQRLQSEKGQAGSMECPKCKLLQKQVQDLQKQQQSYQTQRIDEDLGMNQTKTVRTVQHDQLQTTQPTITAKQSLYGNQTQQQMFKNQLNNTQSQQQQINLLEPEVVENTQNFDLKTSALLRQTQKPETKTQQQVQNFQSVRKLTKKFRGAEDLVSKTKMLNLE